MAEPQLLIEAAIDSGAATVLMEKKKKTKYDVSCLFVSVFIILVLSSKMQYILKKFLYVEK